MERAFSFVTHKTRPYLSRQRPSVVLSIYAVCALAIALLSYTLTFTLGLHPLATVLFQVLGRSAAHFAPPAWGDPHGKATFVVGAESANATAEHLARRAFVNYAALPMRRPEADLILSYLRPTDVYLEFGASATTLSFPHFVKEAYAVEHDKRLCKVIGDEMIFHSDLSNLRAFCAAVAPGRGDWGRVSPLEEGSYRAFHDYVDVPRSNLSNVVFDRVLINGRARVACALRILPQLHADSIVFFHDYFLRPAHYSSVLRFYDEVARIVAHGPVDGYTDEPMGLLVLRPKHPHIPSLADVSVARVNAIYDSYHERPDSAEQASVESAFKALPTTTEGGFPYYRLSRELARETSRMRLLLDLLAIPFVVLTYLALRFLFVRFFLDSLSTSSRSAAIARGDLSAASGWSPWTSVGIQTAKGGLSGAGGGGSVAGRVGGSGASGGAATAPSKSLPAPATAPTGKAD